MQKKLIIISNYFNHYMKALSDALYSRLREGFAFIETEALPEDRKALGWKELDTPYLVRMEDAGIRTCEEMSWEAQAVIWGSAPARFIRRRLREGRLTLIWSERLFKAGDGIWQTLPRALKWNYIFRDRKNAKLLAIGAYTADDYRRIGLFRGEAYRWGYITEVRSYNPGELLAKKKENSICWAGRLLNWKHPEMMIRLAEDLAAEDIPFQMTLIGSGEVDVQAMTEARNLGSHVRLINGLPADEVREIMEQSAVFISTSDRGEGWGVVVNEAMNSLCAVVVPEEIGAAPVMIKHHENGVRYSHRDYDGLFREVKRLLNNRELCDSMGRAAYNTIKESWTPQIAAERLLEFVDGDPEIRKGLFKSGLLSRIE